MEKLVLMLMMTSLMYLVYCDVEKRDVLAGDAQLLQGIMDRLDRLETAWTSIVTNRVKRGLRPSSGGGAMYTRWGTQSCPTGADLVYTGQAGGSNHGHSGAAVNYLCLPFNPNWDKYSNGVSNHAYVYGAEIVNVHHGHDVSCSVCRSRFRSSTLMVPGRNHCDKGWHLEYKGYLMAGQHNHKAATEYVCMDGNPQMLHGGHKHNWENIFYSVEAICGTLKCPPYKQGREFTCAVCTK